MKHKDRTDSDLKKDQAEDFDLTDISDEELFVRDDDIIGLSDEPPVLIGHTDETLDNGGTETVSTEDDDLLNAETIISPSDFEEEDTETLTLDKRTEDEEHLKIGDVLDTDAMMIVGSEDGDETISGLEEEFPESGEPESDTSERIIVAENIEDISPSPEKPSEPDIVSLILPEDEVGISEEDSEAKNTAASVEPSDDIDDIIVREDIPAGDEAEEVLELEESAILPVSEDKEDEQDETIELIELAEDSDKDISGIRDIDDILGLGAEVLEDTRELIVPIGFHPSEEDKAESDRLEEHVSSYHAEKEIFEEDSTNDLMTEVEKMLAAQEETQIAGMEDQTDISSENVRETFHVEDIADQDISQLIEKISKSKTAQAEVSVVREEIGSKEAGVENEFQDIAPEHDLIRHLSEIKDELSASALKPDVLPDSPAEEEDILDADAATIIASPQEIGEIQDSLKLSPKGDDRLSDIDFDLKIPEIGLSEEPDEDEIADTDAATIIAPPQEIEEIRKTVKVSPEEDDSLSDIDFDLEIPASEAAEEPDGEDILDADAETIIASPQEIEEIRKTVKTSFEEDDSLSDIDFDLKIPASEPSEEPDEEDIFDADAATIIASPQEIGQYAPKEDDLLDIDLEVRKLVTSASDDLEDIDIGEEDISDAATVIAEDYPQSDISIEELSEEDILDLTPDTIVVQPPSRITDTTTQKLDGISFPHLDQSVADRDMQTVFLPREEEDTETLRRTPEPPSRQTLPGKKEEKPEDTFTAEVLKELLPVRKEQSVKAVENRTLEKIVEEPVQEPEILEGEIFEDEEKELLKFLEMDLTPIDLPEAKDKDEDDPGLGLEDEYVPIEEVMKNPQEGDGTVIEDMIRGAAEYSESKGESQIYISITPEQMEAALERVIQKVFSEKIEHIVTQVIEKTFTEELEKKLRIILMQDDENRR